MNLQRAITLDRAPIYTLILFLLVSWACTEYYLDHVVVPNPTPFTPVWAAYDAQDARVLITWAVVGLILALLVPLPGRTAPWTSLIDTIGRQVRPLTWLWLMATFGVMALLVMAKGKYLFTAPQYLMFDAPSAFVSLVSVVEPVAVLSAGFVSVRRPTLGRLAMIMWLILLFACATRVFAGVVLLYVVGRFLAGGRITWPVWIATAVITVVLLPIPLFCRNLTMHGLVPYTQAMGELMQNPSFFADSLVTTSSSFGFTVPLLVMVSKAHGISSSDMLISLNPGPGSLVGWDTVMPTLRVHEFIPYSTLGEWASFGGPALMACTLIWGLVVRICLKSVASNPHPTMVLFMAAVLGMSMLTVVMITQYNTRSVSRILSLMLFVTLLERLARPWTKAVLTRSRPRSTHLSPSVPSQQSASTHVR